MHRRLLLKSAGMTLIGLQTAFLTGCDRASIPSESEPAQAIDLSPRGRLEQIAANLQGIEFVGPACVDEAMESDPLSVLLDDLPGSESRPIEDRIVEAMSNDYANAQTFDIDGWQLSRSECLLLAGAALRQGLSEPTRERDQDLIFEDFIEIERWGPDETIEGEIFNEVGDGRGAFWVRVAEPAPASTRLVLGETMLATHFGTGVVTASLDPEQTQAIISKPGIHRVMLVDIATNNAQTLGHLTVRARPPFAQLSNGRQSEVFCEIERWGPDSALEGQAFNEQPDGSAAFWVRIGCAPHSAELEIDGRRLRTNVRTGLITARVPFYADLRKGDYPIDLIDIDTGERLQVGVFRIL